MATRVRSSEADPADTEREEDERAGKEGGREGGGDGGTQSITRHKEEGREGGREGGHTCRLGDAGQVLGGDSAGAEKFSVGKVLGG